MGSNCCRFKGLRGCPKKGSEQLNEGVWEEKKRFLGGFSKKTKEGMVFLRVIPTHSLLRTRKIHMGCQKSSSLLGSMFICSGVNMFKGQRVWGVLGVFWGFGLRVQVFWGVYVGLNGPTGTLTLGICEPKAVCFLQPTQNEQN